MKKKFSVILPQLFLLLFFIFIAFLILNVNLNTRIPMRDSGVFLNVARQVLDGKIPYIHLWDHKPPLIYFINALALLIDNKSLFGLWFLEFLFLSASTIVCYFLLKKSFRKGSAIFGTTIFLLTFAKLLTGGNYTEEYALLFQFLILLFFVLAEKENKYRFYPFIGIFSALIFLLKINAIGITISIILYLIIQKIISNKKSHLIKKFLDMSLGFIFVLAIILLYLLFKKAFDEFIDQVFKYNFIYQKVQIQNKFNAIYNFFKIIYPTSILLIFSYLINLYIFFREKNKTSILNALIIILFPIELILISLSGRDYWHYYICLLPSIAILIASLISNPVNYFSSFLKKHGLGKKLLLITVYILLGIIYLKPIYSLVYKNLSLEYRLIGRDFKPRTFRFNNFEEKQDTIDLINKTTSSNDPILIYGSESALYFITQRNSPTRYFYQYPLFIKGYVNESKINEFLTDLKNNMPKIIIDASTSTADIGAEKSYLLEPIYFPEREKWLKEKGFTTQPKEYKDIFNFFDNNYEFIGTTYSNKWYVFKYNE
ncbi:hypothetical protein A2159_01665 [Candidatus Woesebacteria bacterium RBG_13_34_9]|uniref:Glycosyltransferase RgtA/B/C/D-like domain-containing protein n=1 Tax=Candidatus Woesebacteria bacterium RBG_13_34_9 TaxID=1802477 RepID=A0A1F7X0D4_9BACT|nr:MAG: hypothetical protein A2159_01665 [Candidatus Woesebacteria bacterium RBG_13_34_9]